MRRSVLACASFSALAVSAGWASALPTIMITGYWPPTSPMIRDWSPIPSQNPVWIGSNWEGRGYDVKAYFPEFPGQTCCNWGKGVGDFEVDYQDTAADWARITSEVRPIAIVTFSRGSTGLQWEFEPAAQRWRLSTSEPNPPGRSVSVYTPDYLSPTRPTDVPIASEPVGNVRESSLPIERTVSAVTAQMGTTQVVAVRGNYNASNLANGFDFGGGFLSGYISYLGCWYQDVHDPALDPVNPCYAAGHVHVGTNVTDSAGEQATAITLRVLISHINQLQGVCAADLDDGSGTGTRDGGVDINDLLYYLLGFETGNIAADLDDGSGTNTPDAGVDINDLLYFLERFEAGC